MKNKNYYLGIDLGTTNSVISWGKVGSNSDSIDAKVIDVTMRDKSNNIIKNRLLPSYVYFKDEMTPIVGEYAKDIMYPRRPDQVAKSVKSYMGKNKIFYFHGNEYKPEQISSFILMQLLNSAKTFFGFYPDNVIITVPASFDSDMRNATIKAAELAGVKTKNPDGSNKNILLDEPRAALYDFINRQSSGEFPDALIDLSEKKNILVYDLGGGTLDVSLHEVRFDSNSDDPVNIQDLAISRYTRIGGDNFDEMISKYLMEKFLDETQLELNDEVDLNHLKAVFRQIGEEVKLGISREISNNELLGKDFSENISYEIMKGNVFDNYPFEYRITYKEYEEIVKELLVKELKYSDYKNLESINKSENIIYPILDVLDKAYNKTGKEPVVDAILLNGGMTKFKLIQNRIKEFFGIEPITAGDQDLAVARGASVYHYMIEKGYKPTAILNDTIGIEVESGKVKHIVQAGVVLPFRSKIIKDFELPTDSSYFDIPFYMGRGNTTATPNRKIGERRVDFASTLKAGTCLEFELAVDEQNILNLKGWVANNPSKKFNIELKPSNGNGETANETVLKKSVIANRYKFIPMNEYKPEGEKFTLNDTFRDFIDYCNKFTRFQGYEESFKRNAMNHIKYLENKIERSVSGKQFIDFVIMNFKKVTEIYTKGRFYLVIGNLAVKYPSQREKIKNFLLSQLPKDYSKISKKYITDCLRPLIESLGKTYKSDLESYLVNILDLPDLEKVRQSCLISLGKVSVSSFAVNKINYYITSVEKGDRIAATWALGRICSRERENPIPIKDLEPTMNLLEKQICNEVHPAALQNIIYAIGEIGDQRFGNDTISKTRAASLKDFLQRYADTSLNNGIANKAKIAIHMLSGEKLSEEDERILLKLRNQN